MKIETRPLESLVALLIICNPIIGRAEDPKWNRSDFEREILLLEITDGHYGSGSVEILEKQEKRKLTPDEKAVFAVKDDEKWKTYEDDLVRFDLPDHSLLKVEVVTPEKRDRISVVGGAVGTTDNQYQRAYRMTVNDLPFGVLLVNEAEWFDDGICLCGPIVHKTCILKEGTLIEFSLLPEGRVKKVQALGEKHRAVLFEWTHSVLTSECYQRIGASIRLKQPSKRSLEEWVTLEQKYRNGSDRLGIAWLRRGDGEARVRSLLGVPARVEDKAWIFENERWDKDGSGRMVSLRVNMVQGKFAGMPSNVWDSRDLEPRQGTLAWAEAVVEKQSENGNTPAKSDKPPMDVALVYSVFKTQAPSSSTWNKWCQVAHELTRKGYRDESLRPVVANRFLDTRVEQHYSAWLLDDYSAEETEELFRKRVRIVLDDCRDKTKEPVTDPGEVWNLFSFMKMKDRASLDLLREASGHPDDTVRSGAYAKAESLPQAEARALAKKAIQSESDDHCLSMACYLIRDVGTKDDVGWLEAAGTRLGTKSLTKVWEEALKALKEAK